MKIPYLHPRSWIGEYGLPTRLKSLGHGVGVREGWREPAAGERRAAPTWWAGPALG